MEIRKKTTPMHVCLQCGALSVKQATFCGCCGASISGPLRPVVPVVQLPDGAAVDDRYDLVKTLGQGGLSIVCLARDRKREGAEVVLKFLPEAFQLDKVVMARLRRQASIAARLHHRNVARLYNLEGRSWQYFVAEYVDGMSLQELLEQRIRIPESGGVSIGRARWLMPQELVPLLEGAAAGLDHAHNQDILHLDVKPSNIFISASPNGLGEPLVKVAEFGVSRELHQVIEGGPRTRSTCTRGYLSPEQIRGDPLDRRTDVYSLGAVAFHLLAGRPAFVGNDIAALVLGREPDPIGHLSQPVMTVLLKTLAKDREQRFATCGEFSLAFRQAVEYRPPVEVKPVYGTVVSAETVVTVSPDEPRTQPAPRAMGRPRLAVPVGLRRPSAVGSNRPTPADGAIERTSHPTMADGPSPSTAQTLSGAESPQECSSPREQGSPLVVPSAKPTLPILQSKAEDPCKSAESQPPSVEKTEGMGLEPLYESPLSPPIIVTPTVIVTPPVRDYPEERLDGRRPCTPEKTEPGVAEVSPSRGAAITPPAVSSPQINSSASVEAAETLQLSLRSSSLLILPGHLPEAGPKSRSLAVPFAVSILALGTLFALALCFWLHSRSTSVAAIHASEPRGAKLRVISDHSAAAVSDPSGEVFRTVPQSPTPSASTQPPPLSIPPASSITAGSPPAVQPDPGPGPSGVGNVRTAVPESAVVSPLPVAVRNVSPVASASAHNLRFQAGFPNARASTVPSPTAFPIDSPVHPSGPPSVSIPVAPASIQSGGSFPSVAPMVSPSSQTEPSIRDLASVSPARDPRCEELVSRGDLLYSAGDVKGALGAYRKALHLDSSMGAVWRKLGLCRMKLNQTLFALHALERARAASPRDPVVLNTLAVLLLKMNKLDRALLVAQEAARANPNDAHIWDTLGQAFQKLGRKEDAIRTFQKALEIDPSLTVSKKSLDALRSSR